MEKSALEHAVYSIESYLNRDLITDQRALERIGECLVNGELVIIRNAFQDAFAERLFTCLDQFADWNAYEGYKNYFHYHHRNIYEERLFPPDLALCCKIFDSQSTKHFLRRLSTRECSGQTKFSASLYLSGDHSLPHNDLVFAEDTYRQVAFIWHLTKNWRSDWGGELFWCPKDRFISPSFNTLILFNVRFDSLHFVTTVSPYAQSKRLAINGWWTGQTKPEDEPAPLERKVISTKPTIEAI